MVQIPCFLPAEKVICGGMRVLHVPDEMGDFGVTHKNKDLLLFQRVEELFPMKKPG